MGVFYGACVAAMADCTSKGGGGDPQPKTSLPPAGQMTCRAQLGAGEWGAVGPAPAAWTHGGGENTSGPFGAYFYENSRYRWFIDSNRWEVWIPSWNDQGPRVPVLVDDGALEIKGETAESCTIELRSDHPKPSETADQRTWAIKLQNKDRFARESGADAVVFQRYATVITRPGTSTRPSMAAGDKSDDALPTDPSTDIYGGLAGSGGQAWGNGQPTRGSAAAKPKSGHSTPK